MRPRFSVVIPTKNNAESIGRCLASVMSQTLAAVEIVVVDAGSTDSTLDAVRTLGDWRVRIMTPSTERDRGSDSDEVDRVTEISLGEARAEGFRRCRGQWAGTLDPSDEVSPTWLARVAKLAERTGASFVTCGGEQRFADMSEVSIEPVAVPEMNGVLACLRSGSFFAPTTYFQALQSSEFADTVAVGFSILAAVIDDGRSILSTPEPLLRWNETFPIEIGESDDERQLSWAMQALEALARSPIPDGQLLARYASIAGEAASRLGRRDEAHKLFTIARDALPEIPRHWLNWATSLVPLPRRRPTQQPAPDLGEERLAAKGQSGADPGEIAQHVRLAAQ